MARKAHTEWQPLLAGEFQTLDQRYVLISTKISAETFFGYKNKKERRLGYMHHVVHLRSDFHVALPYPQLSLIHPRLFGRPLTPKAAAVNPSAAFTC